MNAQPRRFRYKRPQRLQAAKSWLTTYTGKNIVHGYRKHFGVDWKTAFVELEMLGVEISPEYKDRVLRSVEAQVAAHQEKAEQKKANPTDEFQDENIAFIAGYTSWGFPYGLTWEEMAAMEQTNHSDNEENTEMVSIPEPDWKALKKLKSIALERLCTRILKDTAALANDGHSGTAHERYLQLYHQVVEADELVAACFNDWSRSNALMLLALWRRESLVTDDELGRFSETTRESVNRILSV